MKILHINNVDLIGKRFNGYELIKPMKELGHVVEQCVWIKQSQTKEVWEILPLKWPLVNKINQKMAGLERRLSIQSLLHLFSFVLLLRPRFYRFDIFHLHLIHNRFFSLLLLPILGWLRKVIWTIHDPWAFTGHCCHPKGCDKWKTGCDSCPDLTTYMSMRKDRAGWMWRVKKWIYQRSQFEVIVASQWMADRVGVSPLFAGKKIHLIPFGVNQLMYSPKDRAGSRKKMLVDDQQVVLMFRAVVDDYKGFEYIQAVLRRFMVSGRYRHKLVLVTVHDMNLLAEFAGYFRVLDYGWKNDLSELYNAADIFLMPSVAEAFGLMAVEALACGVPVIAFKNTGVEEVVGDAGICVEYQNVDHFEDAIVELIETPEKRREMSIQGVRRAKDNFSEELYLKRLDQVYRQL